MWDTKQGGKLCSADLKHPGSGHRIIRAAEEVAQKSTIIGIFRCKQVSRSQAMLGLYHYTEASTLVDLVVLGTGQDKRTKRTCRDLSGHIVREWTLFCECSRGYQHYIHLTQSYRPIRELDEHKCEWAKFPAESGQHNHHVGTTIMFSANCGWMSTLT